MWLWVWLLLSVGGELLGRAGKGWPGAWNETRVVMGKLLVGGTHGM